MKLIDEETCFVQTTKNFDIELDNKKVLKICAWNEMDNVFNQYDKDWQTREKVDYDLLNTLTDEQRDKLDDFITDLTL